MARHFLHTVTRLRRVPSSLAGETFRSFTDE